MQARVRLNIVGKLLALSLVLVSVEQKRFALAQSPNNHLLSPGAVIEHALTARAPETFWVELDRDEFFYAIVEQKGVDIIAELKGPNGSTVFSQDGPNGSFGPECIAFVAGEPGQYRLIISTSTVEAEVPSAKFELQVVAIRKATTTDGDHMRIEQALAQGQQLRTQNTATARSQALDLFTLAARLSAEHGLRHEQALAEYGIGLSQIRGGNPREAIPHFERALNLFEQLGVNMYASAVNALGGSFDLLGESRRAREYYQRALEYFKRNGAISGQGIAHNNIGKLYADASDVQNALREYRAALALFRQARDRFREALALYNIGAAYIRLGDFDRGIEFLQQALEIRVQTEERAGEADALMNIGRAELARGNSERALEILQRALAIRQIVGDRRVEGVTRTLIGDTYLSLGDVTRAREAFDRASRLLTAAGDRRGAAETLLSLAGTEAVTGSHEAAIALAGKALSEFRDIGDTNGSARALSAIAASERAMGMFGAALQHSELALRDVEQVRARVASVDLRASYLARRYVIPRTHVAILMDLANATSESEYAARAFTENEQARARGLVEIVREAGADITRGADPALLDRERRLLELIRVKSERAMPLIARDRNSPAAQAFLREISALEAEYDEVKAAIRASSAAYDALTDPASPDLSRIQRSLDEQTVLIEYALGDDRSYAWIVQSNSFRSVRLERRAEIERAAREAATLITARGISPPNESPDARRRRINEADRATAAALRRLSELVILPLGNFGEAQRLLVVADGALQYIPFGILPVAREAASTTLVEGYEIVAIPSMSVLLAQRESVKARGRQAAGVAVVADPVFDRRDSRVVGSSGTSDATREIGVDTARILQHISRLEAPAKTPAGKSESIIPRLPFTRNEADAILAVAKGRNNFTALGFAATKETVLGGALKDYRIIHFATHGFLDTERPTLSSIVLSLVDRNGNPIDGFLRTPELYNLDLNADLVVLSACQTGLGKSIEGEGLIGLTRGLMYAGAQRVVVSLWNVSDRATAALMGRFYRQMLVEGKPPSAALRAAQLAIMKTKGWEHPYYWAPFIMQGDWR